MRNLSLRVKVLILLLTSGSASFSQPGALDPTFANDGTLLLHPEFEVDEAAGIAVYPNGKILVLSRSVGAYLLRFNADGTPDNSFGISGKLKILSNLSPTALAIDALERIVLYGEVSYSFSTEMYLFRLMPDGTEDLTFGNNGEVETNMVKGNRALLIQSDGKILAGGGGSGQIASIKRYNEDGSKDLSFNGTGGIALNVLPKSCAFTFAQQSDGKLLVTGYTNYDLFIARLNADGTLDNSFDNDGYAIVDEGALETGQGIALMPDGRIIISGHSETENLSSMLLWAFLPDGSIDNSFGINGSVNLFQGPENNFGWFVFPDDDSSMIAGGSIFNGISYDPVIYHLLYNGAVDFSFGNNGVGGKTFTCGKSIQLGGTKTTDGNILFYGTKIDDGNNLAAISQLLSTGFTDTSFGISGTAYTSTADSFYYPDKFFDLTYLANGKSLSSGMGPWSTLFLMRLTEEGEPDSTFGGDGFLAPAIFRQNFSSIIAHSDSALYLSENYFPTPFGFEDLKSPGGYHFAIHKLLPDGLPDSSFGMAGTVYPDFPNIDMGFVDWATIDQDGKLLISGWVFTSSITEDLYLIRFNPDGSPDSTFNGDGVKVFDWGGHDTNPYIGIRSDGKIIFESFFYSGTTYVSIMRTLRLLSDGTLDPSFGNGGIVDHEINFHSGSGFFLQPDNKPVTLVTLYPGWANVLIRLNEDGTIDTGFGVNGYLTIDMISFIFPATQLQADGKILCSGGLTGEGIGVIRYLSDGTIDQTFGINGTGIVPGVFLNGDSQYILRMQDDGKILVGGPSYTDLVVARLLNDLGTDVAENKNDNDFSIYPNPVGDNLFVQFPAIKQSEALVSVIDIKW